MTLAFIVHLYIYVVRDFFFSPNRVMDCCVKLDKMSHCCSFDTSLSKTTTRGNYIIILLLGMTSYYHVLTIWPLVALYLKVNALQYKRIDRVQKRCIRSEANTTNVELHGYMTAGVTDTFFSLWATMSPVWEWRQISVTHQ